MNAKYAHDRWLERAARPKRLLIIEDDPNLNELFRISLEEYHADPIFATSGDDAIRMIEDPAVAEFDRVILDYMLPGMSGFDVTATIIRIRPKLPIIIFSGFLTTETILKVSRLGLVGFAYKPSMETLPALLRLYHMLGIEPLKVA